MRRIAAICSVVLLLCPIAMAANPLDVVINEVAWMGAGGTDEWIELYNNTGSDVDLTGWYILDDVSNRYDLSGTITANGYFLIEKVEAATEIQSDLIVGTISLANSGDDLELFDALDNSIDSAASGGAWFAGATGYTMERRNTDYAGTAAPNWGDNDGVTFDSDLFTNHNLYGTPRAVNSIEGTLDLRPKIIHVHNLDADNVDVTFDQEVTQASAEVAANYTVDTSINPATATLDGSDATLVHLVFNNGDLVDDGGPYNLVAAGVENAGGDVSDTSADFVGGIATVAFVRDDSDSSTLPDLLEDHPDAFMTVTGVTTAVGAFTYQESFFQDATGGIALFDAATTGSLTVGDEILVSGKLDSYNGKDELIETRADIVSQGNVIGPMMLTLADLNAAGASEMYESMLVGVAQVTNTGNGDAWPADNTNADVEITDDASVNLFDLFIDRDTDIDGSAEPTWPVDVQGIVGQYDGDGAPYDTGYSVQPRDLGDIQPNGGFCNVLDATQTCYSGPAGTEANAPCQAGTQTCDGTYWGDCAGEVTPAAADDVTCDSVDDDCDGDTDEDVDTMTDPLNCGACGNDCTDDYANAAGVCNQGVCEMGDCDANYGDCNTDDQDGCELPLGTDTDCSACGDDCTDDYSADHILGVCTAGACAVGACEDGWGDCDTSGDSCETELGSDTNCSACGDDCTDDFLGVNATGTCNVDTCQIGACLANYGDCDTSGDSCETALTSNTACGDCNTACTGDENCVSNAGDYECSASCPDSDGDGYADEACGGADCDDDDIAVNPGATEICDDEDNNCNDAVDETFDGKGDACDGPDADECANGTLVCNQAGDGLECDGDAPAVEACDGVDNDCDGDTDEDWPTLGEACDGDDADLCANGELVCNGVGTGVECREINQNKDELCNNIDDDCDGDTDEGFGQYTCGRGACHVTVDVCIDGQYQSCVPLDEPEHVEVSCDDGIDNDCDDYTDGDDMDCIKGGGGGCSCSTAQSNRTGAFGLMLLGLLAVFRRRRM